MSKKKGGFWSDFKAFITRGNVVDMAVGVVIGGAFGKIVTGLVNYVINPCVSLLTDGTDLDNIKTVLRKGVEATEGVEAVPEVAILWGNMDTNHSGLYSGRVLHFPCTARDDARQEQAGCEEDRRGRSRQGCRASGADAAAEAAKAAEEAAVARQAAVEDAILRQEQLLAELVETVKSK